MPSDEMWNMEVLEHYLLNDDSDDLVPPSLDDETTSDRQNLPVPHPLLPSRSFMEIDDHITIHRMSKIIQSS